MKLGSAVESDRIPCKELWSTENVVSKIFIFKEDIRRHTIKQNNNFMVKTCELCEQYFFILSLF